jgi:CDGSH-type Zn-finger protein
MPITCKPNGPYFVTALALKGAAGEELAIGEGTALCRCGGSAKKPFCDGTHRRNGFQDKNLADPSKNKRTAYAGKSVTILDNRAICAHAGFCSDGLKEVFKEEGDPWIDPDGASVAQVIATIERCPSGALSYAIEGKEVGDRPGSACVTVTRDGPYAVSGGVELAGVSFGDGASQEHYTLCRCGASKNKPFCDGSHWDAGFKDPA